MTAKVQTAPVFLHHLIFLDDGEEVMVGRRDIDSYAAFPPDGAALLRELGAGRGLASARQWYLDTYGEQVDLEEFLALLHELEFVRTSADAGAAIAPGREPEAPPVAGQRWGRAAFSPVAWLLYAVLVMLAVAVCVADPRLAPVPSHVFFTPYLSVVEASVLFGQTPLIAVHELFHVLAGRRLGLRTRVRLSYRFLTPVVETSLDGLVTVPRQRRALPMLAGLLADVLVVAGLTVTAALARRPDGSMTLFGGLCLALAFTTLPRIAWQFFLHLRTDLYHMLVLVLGCDDLHSAARQRLRNRLHLLLRRPDRLADEQRFSRRDRAAARWFAPLLVFGYTASAATALGLVLPLSWRFITTAFERTLDPSGQPARFWDATTVLILTLSEFALAGALAWQQRRRQRQPVHPA